MDFELDASFDGTVDDGSSLIDDEIDLDGDRLNVRFDPVGRNETVSVGVLLQDAVSSFVSVSGVAVNVLSDVSVLEGLDVEFVFD